MCNLLCCFGCLTIFGFRDRVCQKLVYFPPPAQYAIEIEPDRKEAKHTMWMIDEHGNKVEPYRSARFQTEMVATKRGETIATMHIGFPGSRTMLLFSHGNATDIGCMRDHLVDLSQQLQINIFTYDYSGYGLSTGKPNSHNTLSDIEAAYDYMTKTYPNECNVIIMYGQSLGTGPTLHLARTKRVTGVVIHSGLMSALRVIKPVPDTRWFDIYPNIDNIKHVTAPVFIIHGTQDVEVPVHHGRGLADAAPNAFKPYWVEGGGHNNIEVHWREQYLERVRNFVVEMERLEAKRATQPATHSPSSLSSNNNGHSNGNATVPSSLSSLPATTVGVSSASAAAASSSSSSSSSVANTNKTMTTATMTPGATEATPLVSPVDAPLSPAAVDVTLQPSIHHHRNGSSRGGGGSTGSILVDSRGSGSSINIGGVGGQGHPPRSPSASPQGSHGGASTSDHRRDSSFIGDTNLSPAGQSALAAKRPLPMQDMAQH